MALFLPKKHSSAATARLTEDLPDVRMARPSPAPSSSSSSAKQPRGVGGGHRLKHRRLESEVNLAEVEEEEERDGPNANDAASSSGSHPHTKSTSFSTSDEEDADDDDSEEDSDNNSNSDDDDFMEGFSSMPSDGISRDSADGLSDGEGSLTSDTTASSASLAGGAAGGSVCGGHGDGDLRELDLLVNRLHVAELKREARREKRHGGGAAGVAIRSSHSCDEEDVISSPVDLPSELPENPPPHFSPLQSSHHLSISAVDSWRGQSLEVIPTEDVDVIMPLWKSQWSDDRLEWEERRKSLESVHSSSGLAFKRSRTANDAGKSLGSPIGLHRRNHSAPNVGKGGRGSHHHHPGHGRSRTTITGSSSSSSSQRHYKYGKPPALPGAKSPNPMVKKSSKKINRKHARYALTAGMMLGIRESVGGAAGVEDELEVRRWEGFERCWTEEGNGAGGDGNDEASDEAEVQLDESGNAEGGVIITCSSQDSNTASSPPTRGNRCLSGSRFPAYAVAATLTAECERVSKYKFPPGQFCLGSNTSRPLPHKYKFKVYAPLVFARIRALFGVEKQTFLHSICGKFNFYEFASNARSGQFFFYSHDGRYMIKTLTYTESKFLREILPHYYRHLSRYPSSFLTHFYGMYRVCMPNYAGGGSNQKLHFIIMRSVFHTEKKIDRVWDLKGSRTGRKAGNGDSVGKDLDILEEGRKLRFKIPGTRAKFLEQLARDATFLARLGIMDYSLLLGLHNREEDRAKDGSSEASALSSTPLEIEGKGESLPGAEEPSRSNTPFRRIVLSRASSAGDTRVGDDGFKALQAGAGVVGSPEVAARKKVASGSASGASAVALGAIPESPPGTPASMSVSSPNKVPKNTITSRLDLGIEGYGIRLEDGTVAKREIYFCGIIDILQYYNARKMGETVIRKAAGNLGEDISCVDPETYGKRFVKFISNLVEEG